VQQVRQLLLAQLQHEGPEPDDDRVSGRVASVDRVVSKVSGVDDLPTVDDEVELVRVEDLEEFRRDDLAESVPEIVEQFGDALGAVVVGPG
jgi:hypothetical protein